MSDADSQLPDLRYLRELAKVIKQYGLDEIEIETGDQRLLLRRGGDSGGVTTIPVAAPAAVAPAPAPAAVSAAPAAPAADDAAPTEDAGDFITSPFVGTFYTKPRPDSDPFIQVGDKVQVGDTVCIVEAMKLFNEIEADFAAEILEVLVENATPVEFGAKLFKVRRL